MGSNQNQSKDEFYKYQQEYNAILDQIGFSSKFNEAVMNKNLVDFYTFNFCESVKFDRQYFKCEKENNDKRLHQYSIKPQMSVKNIFSQKRDKAGKLSMIGNQKQINDRKVKFIGILG